MGSAKKYIAKCRKKGYSDEKIRKAVAGKTPALRDSVLKLLDAGAAVDVDKTLAAAADEDLALDSEMLEIEAVGEAQQEYAQPEPELTPEMIDDLPPAVFAETEEFVEAEAEIIEVDAEAMTTDPETEDFVAALRNADEVIAAAVAEDAQNIVEASQPEAREVDAEVLAAFARAAEIPENADLETLTAAAYADMAADDEAEKTVLALPTDLTISINEEIVIPDGLFGAADGRASAYQAPELTLINCEKENTARAETEEVPVLRPAYAISPEETAARLEQCAAAETPVVDFAARAREISAECWQGVSEDFDGIARPAESEWADNVRRLFDNDEQGLREEIFSIQRELVESEDGLKMLELEAGALRERLGERDARLAQQEAEIARLKAERAGDKENMEKTSVSVEQLGKMRQSLEMARVAGEELRAENAGVLANLEKLRDVMGRREEELKASNAAYRELQERYAEECQRNADNSGAAVTVAALRAAVRSLQHAGTALQQEIAEAHRDLADMRGALAGRDNAITVQGREITRLRALAQTLEDGVDVLRAGNEELRRENAEITARAEENAAHAEDSAKILELSGELAAMQGRLENTETDKQALSSRVEELERERNILVNETVPNLQKDKEDLVRMVGEEVERADEYNNVISLKSRRLSYALSMAAAACVAVVLVPVFSMNRLETKEMELKDVYGQKVAQVEATRTVWEKERATLHARLQTLQTNVKSSSQKLETERQQWRGQLTALQTALRTSKQELAVSQSQLAELKAAAENRTVMASADTAATLQGGSAGTQYNDVKGVEEWRNRQAVTLPPDNTAKDAAPKTVLAAAGASADVKTVKVRRGEGLSQLLWRVCGKSSPEMVAKVTAFNRLKTDRRGNPLLQVGQEIRLPDVPQNRTAMR